MYVAQDEVHVSQSGTKQKRIFITTIFDDVAFENHFFSSSLSVAKIGLRDGGRKVIIALHIFGL